MDKEKEVYLTPTLETVLFEEEDIITTSSDGPIELPSIPIPRNNVW